MDDMTEADKQYWKEANKLIKDLITPSSAAIAAAKKYGIELNVNINSYQESIKDKEESLEEMVGRNVIEMLEENKDKFVLCNKLADGIEHSIIEPNKRYLICPDCNSVLVKTFTQCSDNSSWMGGYSCNCQPTKEQKNHE